MRKSPRTTSPVATLVAVAVVALAFGVMPNAHAQFQPPAQSEPIEPIDEEELEEFAFVLVEVQTLQRRLSDDIDQMVAKSELSEETFYEIYQLAQQLPEGTLPDGYTDDELEHYEMALGEVMEAQTAT